MENQLQTIDILNSNIEFTVSDIKYDFTEILKKAKELQIGLETVTVTEDTVKSNKKLVAELNKVAGRLNDERILVKRQLLEPYNQLEVDVKEIVSIIKDTDEGIRSQIKELDEIDRERKECEIYELFKMRQSLYKLDDYVSFDSFLEQRHLNKTTTMKAIEQDIVDYFEKVKSDILIIDNVDNKEMVLELYLDSKDIGQAIGLAKQRLEREEQVKNIVSRVNGVKPVVKEIEVDKYIIEIVGNKDLKLATMLFDEHEINYNIVKGLE